MEHVKATTPQMNQDITEGLAVKMLPKALEHLDAVVQSVAKDFIPGLRYIGFERCLPEEELRKTNNKKNDKYVIETAKSSIYLTKLRLAYTDPKAIDVKTGKLLNQEEELDPCYIYVPYVGEAGMLKLSGAKYFLSPILADVVLSFEKDCIFLNLLRAKFGIRNVRHIVLRDGIHEEHKILWSNIYHIDDSEIMDKVETKPESTLVNYLFCVKGLYSTFIDYAGCTPIIGTKEINHENYPISEYTIFSSAKLKLKGSKISSTFTNIKVAIKKPELNSTSEGLVTSLFYLLDHFPDEFKNIEWLNDKRKWRLILGRIIFGKSRTAGSILEAIDDHFKSLDQYLDTIVKYKLESIGIFVNNIYDFFAHAIQNYKEWSFKSKENLNSIFDKELSILHYTLGEIVNSINTFYFKLKSVGKTADKKHITKEDINKIAKSIIKPKKIFGIKDNPSGLTNIAYPGDNSYMKITSNVIPQKSLSKTGNDEIDISDPVNYLHESFMAIGSHLNLPKSSPIGYRTLSPYVQLDKDNRFIIDPVEKQWLNNVHEIIRRK